MTSNEIKRTALFHVQNLMKWAYTYTYTYCMTVSWWWSVFWSPQSHQFVLQPQASKRANHHRDATPLGSKGKWQKTANSPEHGVPLNPLVNHSVCISFHFLSKHWHLHFLWDTPPHHHHHHHNHNRLIFHRVQPLYRNRAAPSCGAKPCVFPLCRHARFAANAPSKFQWQCQNTSDRQHLSLSSSKGFEA